MKFAREICQPSEPRGRCQLCIYIYREYINAPFISNGYMQTFPWHFLLVLSACKQHTYMVGQVFARCSHIHDIVRVDPEFMGLKSEFGQLISFRIYTQFKFFYISAAKMCCLLQHFSRNIIRLKPNIQPPCNDEIFIAHDNRPNNPSCGDTREEQ